MNKPPRNESWKGRETFSRGIPIQICWKLEPPNKLKWIEWQDATSFIQLTVVFARNCHERKLKINCEQQELNHELVSVNKSSVG
ncbi:hypothetical protein GWI33_005837 [Rhynchophorus ferrugineus]|uniref:Uncharacterized protein n=1 Tax=Rhynchophorus ferrugineus TaxID=354439 RepID=A0A834ME60_RHYFE|nr:hypothetical protein GWI33_005837 [Rhynchophorus ferrugineus]